jgi:hypothetical protein
MATKQSASLLGIEDILTDTAEAQIAAFNAGIEFWSQWVSQTTQLSKSIETKLDSFKRNPVQSVDLLMEITEANRKYLREMNTLPREVANKFVSEMDRLKKKKSTAKKKTNTKPIRRARVKP